MNLIDLPSKEISKPSASVFNTETAAPTFEDIDKDTSHYRPEPNLYPPRMEYIKIIDSDSSILHAQHNPDTQESIVQSPPKSTIEHIVTDHPFETILVALGISGLAIRKLLRKK